MKTYEILIFDEKKKSKSKLITLKQIFDAEFFFWARNTLNITCLKYHDDISKTEDFKDMSDPPPKPTKREGGSAS